MLGFLLMKASQLRGRNVCPPRLGFSLVWFIFLFEKNWQGKYKQGKKQQGKRPSGEKIQQGKDLAGKRSAGKRPSGEISVGKRPARKIPTGKRPRKFFYTHITDITPPDKKYSIWFQHILPVFTAIDSVAADGKV